MSQQPSAEEFVRNWYDPDGNQITGEKLQLLVEKLLPALSTTLPDGTPQVTTPSADAVSKGCQAQINALAQSNASWAKSVGHQGLFKVLTACISEQNGNAPTGFTQQVVSALEAPWWKKPSTWALLAVIGIGGYYYARKKKRR